MPPITTPIEPILAGRVCLVTGASNGIGETTAAGLASLGAHVLMVCRDPSRGRAAIERIRQRIPSARLDLLMADLSSQSQIRQLATQINNSYPAHHVLINNAGIFSPRRQLSPDGIELTFAVNHLAPFLLTHLLLDKIKSSAPARIITISSKLHERARLDLNDLQISRRYSGLKAYSNSKLANVLFTYELSRRLTNTNVTANAVHPGGVATNISSGGGFFGLLWKILRPILLTPEQGAQTSIHVASDPELESITGTYFAESKPAPSSPASHDPSLAARLWDASAQLTGL